MPISAELCIEDAAIILGTLFWVAEDLVRFCDLSETASGVLCTVIFIRVQFSRQAAIGRLYLGARRILRDPQNLVIIRHLVTLGEV